MKAAQINAYGGQEVLKTVDDAPKPQIGPDQVLIKVQAAAANPFDYKIRDGDMQQFIPLKFPATLGGDLAGTVAEIGEDVSGFTIGQAVYGQAGAASGQGSFAEYAPVNAEQLSPKPESVDFTTAAALPLAATSAYQALVEHIDLQPGQKILIHGGAGGIGAPAIQIAKNIGAHVVTTVSTNDVDYAKELGADEVIDYTKQDFAALVKDCDAVFDMVGGETNAQSYTTLKPGGTFLSMVMKPDDDVVREYNITYIHQSSRATSERLAKVAELVDAGKLKINVDKAFPLDQAAEALEYLKTGHPRGKVVIQIAD